MQQETDGGILAGSGRDLNTGKLIGISNSFPKNSKVCFKITKGYTTEDCTRFDVLFLGDHYNVSQKYSIAADQKSGFIYWYFSEPGTYDFCFGSKNSFWG